MRYLLLLFLIGTVPVFAGSSISDHLTEIDGIDRSIESAEEEMKAFKEKFKEEKSLEARALIKKDMDALNKSVKMFKELQQKVMNHVMLEHSKKDRREFKKNMANREKMRQRAGGSPINKPRKKWP